MNVGPKLKALRLARRLSQKQVAEGIHCSPNTYSRYENGKRQPSYATLRKLADFFGVSMDYLFDRTPLSGAELSSYQIDLLEAAVDVPYEVQDTVKDYLVVKKKKRKRKAQKR